MVNFKNSLKIQKLKISKIENSTFVRPTEKQIQEKFQNIL